MICLRVTFTVRAGAEEECKRLMQIMMEHTVREPGCRAYVGWQSTDNARKFFFYEVYDNEAALQAHRSAAYFEQYVTNGLAKLMDSSEREIYKPV
ncbi:MAG TPA: putative quinol monooxygenase [Terriglobales bacterium]|nr:putative quinol monooxygenase [Terriglobales bacterium]